MQWSFRIEAEVTSFIMCPTSNLVSDFEDASIWISLSDGMDAAVEDPTIFLNQYHLPSDGCLALVVGIIARTASIVSDGSFNPESLIEPAGTSAVILVHSTNCLAKFYAKGNNWVTGSREDQSAYRSKLAGVIAALTMLDILVCRHELTEGFITIALDGDATLIQSGGDWPLSVDQPTFDYLQVIWAWIKLFPLKFNFRYVKGHQIDLVKYDQLDWWGQRNEDVDQAAKKFLHDCTTGPIHTRRSHVQPELHLEKWALTLHRSKLTSITRDWLYTNLIGCHTLAYWAKKDNIPTGPARILWEGSPLARKKMSRAQRHLDTKLLSKQCVLAKTLFQRKYQDTHSCPVCSIPFEDRDHLYTCPDAGANKVFKKGIYELEQILDEKETAPDIQKAIIGSLNDIHIGNLPHQYTLGRTHFGQVLSLQGIMSDQADIGWINFFPGRWSVKWKEAQKGHYQNMNKKKSARLWVVAILQKLMMIRWDVDDLKVSHKDQAVLEDFLNELRSEFGQEDELTVNKRLVHEYLGITIDYLIASKVVFTIFDYLEDVIVEVAEDLKNSHSYYLEIDQMFKDGDDSPRLLRKDAETFHRHVARL